MSEQPSNFGFLESFDRRLCRLGQQAESYAHSDPQACLFKLRLMVELMATTLARTALGNAMPPELGVTLGELERTGVLPRREADNMHAIRRDGNAAVHGGIAPTSTALRRLRDAHMLSRWYLRSTARGADAPDAGFVLPQPAAPRSEVDPQTAAAEALEDQIEQRRKRTREALLLFPDASARVAMCSRFRAELNGLDTVAATAGEPSVDAPTMALIMALEIEELLEHPSFGPATRDAHTSAQAQLNAVKARLDEQEATYREARERLTQDFI